MYRHLQHCVSVLNRTSKDGRRIKVNRATTTFHRLCTSLSRIAIVCLPILGISACGGSGAGKTAYVGATVFDGSGAPPIHDAVIIVANGRIEAIGPADLVKVPRGAQELRVDGRWIIPGLIDSHVHASSWTLTRFLSYGITSVRSLGGPNDEMAALRDSVALNSLIGPRMFISGAMIDGSPATWPSATAVRSESEARAAVDNRVLLDATQVKVYSKINRNLLAAIVDEAEALEIPVVAHLGMVDAITAARMGVRSLEHMTGVVEATLADPSRLFRAHASFFGGWKSTSRAWASLDSAALGGTAQALVAEGTTIVPTLVLYETFAHLADADYISQLDLSGVPESVRDDWDVPDLIRRALLSRSDFQVLRRSRPVQDLFVRLYQDLNGLIVAGSDTPNQLLAPGASLHDELALLVNAGLSPKQALLSATRNAARLLGADSLGVLLPGNVADFVVLTGDPLADINNTRTLDRVVLKGVSYHPAEFRLEW
jgi:imidazolonepropionase-like amidohydrolase